MPLRRGGEEAAHGSGPGGEEPDRTPPVVPAMYDGRCSECGEEFDEGDLIQADQHGGWRSECCIPQEEMP